MQALVTRGSVASRIGNWLLTILALAMATVAAQAQELNRDRTMQARPWLGVAIDKGDIGVRVKDVITDTPAAAAGIKPGDQIQSVEGKAVTTPQELIAAVQAQGVGNTVTIVWLRAGKSEAHKIKLVARPEELELLRQQLVNKPAPSFNLERISGTGPLSTAELKGKVAVVEFWATWCPACRSTHHDLSQFAKAHAKDINVVAISDEEAADVKSYSAAVNPNFTILRDADHKASTGWHVMAIPQIAVIDATGKVVYATVGGGAYLEEALTMAANLASGK